MFQESLGEPYASMTADTLDERIRAHKARLGDRLVILGHHYQRDDVIRYADFTGDSLRLSQLAGRQHKAQYIVFCGVHFMAESADMLTRDDQAVILPDLSAGCPMADMADATDLQTCLDEVTALAGGAESVVQNPAGSRRSQGVGRSPKGGETASRIVPVTYVNSTAAVKAVTGRAGGACCTSGNCRTVLEWALRGQAEGGAGAEKVLAAPDQHLARATALDMGYTLDDCLLYRPAEPNGGLTAEQVRSATFILWEGYCSVHQRFTVEQIARRREQYPGIQVIVHPECPIDVVQAADLHGSTEQILRAIADAAPGSKWAVGTEANLVDRLAGRYTDRLVVNLADRRSVCASMSRIDPAHVCWVLDNLAEGRIVNRITVAPDVKADALIALDRMVRLKGTAGATRTA